MHDVPGGCGPPAPFDVILRQFSKAVVRCRCFSRRNAALYAIESGCIVLQEAEPARLCRSYWACPGVEHGAWARIGNSTESRFESLELQWRVPGVLDDRTMA